MMCATLLDPNQPNQCFTASPVRARERQIRAPKKGILGALGRDSYTDDVTVYPYNGHIAGTNMNVRCSDIFLQTLMMMFVKRNNLR